MYLETTQRVKTGISALYVLYVFVYQPDMEAKQHKLERARRGLSKNAGGSL